MKVGVKFCGGCQNRYNRKKALQTIREGLNGAEFEFVHDGGVYDVLLVLAGCHIKCASIEDYAAEHVIWCDSDDVEPIIERLRSLE